MSEQDNMAQQILEFDIPVTESVVEATGRTARPSVSTNSRRKTFNGRRRTADDESIEETAEVIRLDLVLDKLERRLREYEGLPAHHFEGKLKTAYEALRTVFKDGASRVGDEAKGRALMVVRLLENKYSGILASSGSMPAAKISGARRFLESALHDIENSYYDNLAYTRQTVQEKISHLQEEISKGTQEASKRVTAIRIAVQAASTRLLEYSELPYEWQNNPYVLTGYRFYESPLKCFLSAFQMHNETGNIWTHLGGFIFLCIVGLYLYPQSPAWAELKFYERLVFFVFLIAALKCLVCSALWHTFAQISSLSAMQSLACLDYVGISVLIAATIVTIEFHGFRCSPIAQLSYVGFTAVLGLIGVVIPWFPWFDKVENRLWRIAFFLGIAISGIVPFTHLMFQQSFIRTWTFFLPVFRSLLCYIFGVVIYASHFPEKLSPGLFDSIGNSHQIWHLAILGGIWFHYKAIQTFQFSSTAFACELMANTHSVHLI